MTRATNTQPTIEGSRPSLRSLFLSLEIDTRMLGMIAALVVIWVGFDIASGGLFLTPRNLWNLSVQSSAIAVMATGMVLIIVSRNIDLSVGSLLGFTGYVMAMVQVVWIPTTLGMGFDKPYTWIVALAIGILIGAALGGFQGFLIAYAGVPSFVVTLGGLLIWRGLVFEIQQGQTISPTDSAFNTLGGGLPGGAIGAVPSWILGFVACAAVVYFLVGSSRKRREYGFPTRPTWALAALIGVACVAILGAVWVANSYPWPPELASQYAVAHHIVEPPGGLQIPVGIAVPVLIMLGAALAMTFIAKRRRFGRYVFAIGGNPEAAKLGGINTRWTIMMTFVLMGILCAISGAIQTARLGAGVTSLGTGDELAVIAAAVVGGTSFAGGVGTIPGAVLGAVVMQSLKSGMGLLGYDAPPQDIAVGAVLIATIGLENFLHRGRSS
ncbi:MAG: sugar ABC transporter permease [Candidatus Limnocylindrales bacterium]